MLAHFLHYRRLLGRGRWLLSASHVVTTLRILFRLRLRLLLDINIRDEECKPQRENICRDANDEDARERFTAGMRQVIIRDDGRASRLTRRHVQRREPELLGPHCRLTAVTAVSP